MGIKGSSWGWDFDGGVVHAESTLDQDYTVLRTQAVIDTFSLHRSEHNVSPDRSRLVQLFRYANLDQPAAVAAGWASVPPRDGLKLFARTHPDKLADPLTAPKS